METTTNMATQVAEEQLPAVQAAEQELPPEESARPLWAAKGFVGEDENARNAHTRCFICGDGVRHVEISNAPLNYFDEEANAWKPLDGAVTEEENEYTARCGKYAARVKKGADGNGVSLTADGVSLSWEFVGADAPTAQSAMRRAGQASCPVCAAHRKEAVQGGAESRIVYENVGEATDLAYCIHGDHVKEDIVVRERGAANAYSFLLHTQGLTACLNEDNTIFLFREDSDNLNAPEMIIPAPFMTDADGARSDCVTYALTEQSDGEYLLTVTADEAWLNAPERVYPVTIDPQVVLPENEKLFSIRNMRWYPNIETWYNITGSLPQGILNLSCTKEYLDSSILTVHKDLIEQSDAHLFQIVLRLYYKENSNCNSVTVVYPDGSVADFYRYYDNQYIDIVLTDAYLKAEGDFSIEIYPGAKATDNHCRFDAFSNNTILEFEYFPDDYTTMIEKEYSLNQNVTALLNITTGEKTTVIEDVPAVCSVMGIPVSHVFKTGCGEPGLGQNFRLSVQEHLYAPNDELYVYSDAYGDCHGFMEHYYYLNDNGRKVYIGKNSVIIDPDGSLHTSAGKKVNKEYSSDTGWKLTAPQTGVQGVPLVEQRSDEQKQLEEQIETYQNALDGYVLMNTSDGTIEADTLTEDIIFSEYTADAKKILVSRDQAFQYQSLSEQLEQLNDSVLEYTDYPENPEQNSQTDFQGVTTSEQTFPAWRAPYESSLLQIKEKMFQYWKYKKDSATNQSDITALTAIWNALRSTSLDTNRIIDLEYVEDILDFDWYNICSYPVDPKDSLVSLSEGDIWQMVLQHNLLVQQELEAYNQREKTKEQLNAQIDNVEKQRQYIGSSYQRNAELLRKYYLELTTLTTQLDALNAQMPVKYLSNGELVKGFNKKGLLVLVYDRFEQYASFEYDTKQDNRLLSISDSNGNAVKFHYTPTGMLDAMTNAFGERITYLYDAGKLTKVSYPDGSELQITYSQSGQILYMEDSNKLRTTCWPQSDARNQEISCISCLDIPETWNDWEKIRRRVLFVQTVNTDGEEGRRVVTVKHPLSATNEEYHFNAFNQLVAYYVEQNDVVVSAERYEYRWNEPPEPYLIRKKVITAKPETLRLCKLSEFVFENGDWEIEEYDRFGNLTTQESSPVKLDEDGHVTLNRTLSRYYDESQNLIRQENHVTVLSDTVEVPEDDGNTEEENPTAVNETLEDYTEVVVNEYDAKGRNICTRSYIEGQQDTAGVVVKETIYNEKGGVIETATYNSLDPTSKFREKQELSDDGRVTGVWDETGLYKTTYEYRADRAAVRHVISPNGAKQAFESDNYSDVEVNSVSTEDGEENSTRKKYDCGLLTELHSGSNDVRYTYDLRRRIADVFINSETPIVSHHHVENSLYNGKSVNDCRTAMANGHVIGVYTRKGDDAVLRTTSSMNGKTWVSKYNYDNLDRLTDKTVTREGIGTVLEKDEYSYDSCNRTTAYTHTMNGIQDESENYLYNTRGELISKEVNVLDKALVFNYERDDTPQGN